MSRNLLASALLIAIFPLLSCDHQGDEAVSSFSSQPTLLGQHTPLVDGDTLRPVGLQMFQDTLFVSYTRRAQIDLYSPDLKLLGTISLTDPEPIHPTSFAVNDSMLIVTDHGRGLVVLYDRTGSVVTSFGTLPDGVTPLLPFSVTEYDGIAYVGDLGTGRVLAVALNDRENVTEQGELILMIPSDTSHSIKFGSALDVTPDGRLLVGDAGEGEVKVFTCDGRFVYLFDSLPSGSKMAPLSFTMDEVIDPAMQDSTSFDPSGVRRLGRIHVADGNNGLIHVFNPLGKYAFSYGRDDDLKKPTGLAVDRKRDLLFVADPEAGRIYQYSFGDSD